MRKKVCLLLIFVLLVVISASLVACNQAQNSGDLPDKIDPDDVIENDESGPLTSYLKFSFPNGATSIFKSDVVGNFDISQVEYCVVYLNTKTQTVTEGMHGNLSDDMLETDADRKNVKRAGHHQIKARAEIGKDDDGNPIYARGSFALHLQDRCTPIKRISLTFNLVSTDTAGGASVQRTALAQFGTTSSDGRTVTVMVDSGAKIASWDEFVKTFTMTIDEEVINGKKYDAKVLESVSVNGKTYSATTSQNFPLELDDSLTNKTIVTSWTNDTVTATFKLCIPSDAKLEDGKTAPSVDKQVVRRSFGKAIAPSTDTLNVYSGYYFAGWYLDSGSKAGEWDEDDTYWNFSKPVGTADITLVARWTKRVYSYTLYTMGGEFKSDVTNAKTDGGIEITSDEVAMNNGFEVVSATSTFGIENQRIMRVELSGFTYNHDFSKYVAKIDVTPQKSVYVRFDQIKDLLVKGNGGYVTLDGIYTDYQCQTVDPMTIVDGKHEKGYAKWVFNETEDKTERLARLSAYYTEVVFKDGLSVKSDGTLRIDGIADESVSELLIPAELTYEGTTYPVSEIAAQSCMNLKGLVKLDLSEAVNLKTIGASAFAYAPYLREIVAPADDNIISSVGSNVFFGTEFENEYINTHGGKQFIVIGKILYKFVGQLSGENDATRASAIKSLDLSNDAYYTTDNTTIADQSELDKLNAQLSSVTTIADGAFAYATYLESITLGNNVERIENGAFSDLQNFATVTVNKSSKLSYVGESAFDDTKMLKTTGGNYNKSSGAIVIGKVYYRFIDKDATSAAIPSGIEHIAPYAFDGCVYLATINFALVTSSDRADMIKSIGKHAFTNTKWIKDAEQNPGGFVVLNGILADYFTESYGKDASHVTIPSNAKTIGEDAFYQYANTVKTIAFGKTDCRERRQPRFQRHDRG